MNLVDQYVSLQNQLAVHLSDAGISISKAKSLQGLALSSVISVDTHEMEPIVKIDINEAGSFSLHQEKEAKDSKPTTRNRKQKEKDEDEKEEKEAKTVKKSNFRPFGILEPLPAKEARHHLSDAINVICELASLQYALKQCDEKISSTLETIKTDEKLMSELSKLVV
ncbi:unnamed protein product [Caenorhabditis auriculariae]|uniref:Vacuolar ATPase assembly protein VMA22 n=1 Tax=Caenorhabditis auriculariae TaxID=2777116 RepID=A0A8S1GPI4_9PELO|nr:unnamed protein product [Caenorhabditis auriculariae]